MNNNNMIYAVQGHYTPKTVLMQFEVNFTRRKLFSDFLRMVAVLSN